LFLNRKNHFGSTNWIKIVSDNFKAPINELNNEFFEKNSNNKKKINVQKLITDKSIATVNND
jgi:hypothetical protein